MATRKPPYSRVKLRITSWTGTPADVGDELRTRAGSRYQIIEIRGMTHHCLTLPADAELQGEGWFWLDWHPRAKKTR